MAACPPDCLAPIARLQKWLDDLRRLPPDAPGVAEEIADAEETIAARAELDQQLAAAAKAKSA
ncbi:hypothetical protein FACS1894116_12890 [Betaproteobacteria bacterium]|nr:hypothetical protein FACS1894116_12890 [Betaproteobacteria bacterium]